jgi:hypothetical protein
VLLAVGAHDLETARSLLADADGNLRLAMMELSKA